ncbi:hypothetical protein [Rossellomorea sp. NS-SX7]|uniref:hypothetical protein n=1 Tax=Rossellomorea sp. NS-SX7 TaxID=3463856 RepID=UPI0040589DC9
MKEIYDFMMGIPQLFKGGISQGLFVNVVWAVFILFMVKMGHFFNSVSPGRRLWNLTDHSKLIVVSATSVISADTGYQKKATGIGQVRALAFIISSLNKAYKKLELKNIYLSGERLGERCERDIISVGGPKNNEVTRDVLKKLTHIVEQVGNDIHWNAEGERDILSPMKENDEVVKDLGLVIRMENPFNDNGSTTLTVFSGCHTYGTVAAAKYFTESLFKKAKKMKNFGKLYVAVVSCELREEHITNVRLEKEYILKQPKRMSERASSGGKESA